MANIVDAEPQVRAGAKIATPESTKLDPSSGAATYRYKIDVPPGTGGLTPDLALTYNSLSKGTEFGWGWSMELSHIERATRAGVPSYNDSADGFELDGETLVPDPSTANLFHKQLVETSRIRYFPNQTDPSHSYWEVVHPGGMTLRYGSRPQASSRITRDDSLTGPVFRWCLDEVIDAKGNAYRIEKHILGDGNRWLTIRRSGSGQPQDPGTTASKTFFNYHGNEVGSNELITDQLGQVVQRTFFDPYGEILGAVSGTGSSLSGSTLASRYLFAKQHAEPEAMNLSFARTRWYDPKLAGFNSPDPALTGEHPENLLNGPLELYAYGLSNPIRYNDPMGNTPWDAVNGAANAFGSDLWFGHGRQSGNSDYIAGQRLGDYAALFTGGVETFFGTGGTVGSLALDATGVGALAGIPAGAVSAGVTAHGLTVEGVASMHINLMKSAGSSSASPGGGDASGAGAPEPRAPTAGNFRTNLERLTGHIPEGEDAHHIFPQKFSEQFEKAGINIHDPRFGAWWEASAHRRAADAYNRAWAEFFTANPSATMDQIITFGRDISRQYGLPVGF
jgi:RHS repeat-associated protein